MLTLHFAICALITGGMWFVQTVHYPLFAMVGIEHFSVYEKAHYKRVLCLVVPMAVMELITALLLGWLYWFNTLLLMATWFMTLVVQVPLHNQLRRGFQVEIHRRLVSSNWWRVGACSLRLVYLAFLL
jgi:hypothetical protein